MSNESKYDKVENNSIKGASKVTPETIEAGLEALRERRR
jgi:hypothetical protein